MTKPRPPIDPVRWRAPPVDALPRFRAPEITLVPVPGDEPEDVVVDAAGHLWAGALDGGIVRLQPDGSAPEVIGNTGGRPLGLAVARDGRLLMCDSPRGLLAMDPGSGRLDLFESSRWRTLKFCSNVTETPDGAMYFTSRQCVRVARFPAPIVQARPRGGLFRLQRTEPSHPGRRNVLRQRVTPTADGRRW